MWNQLLAAFGKLAAAAAVAGGAILGFIQGGNGDLSTSLGDAIAGGVTGATVVLIAGLTVRWVNGLADRREKAADVTVTEYRELYEAVRAELEAERVENARLTAENTRLREARQ